MPTNSPFHSDLQRSGETARRTWKRCVSLLIVFSITAVFDSVGLQNQLLAQPLPATSYPGYPLPPPLYPQAVPLPVPLPPSQTPEKLRVLTAQFPLCVVVSESFANRFVERETREAGPIRDFVLGAQVVGQQQTVAKTQMDFISYEQAARMQVLLNGSTNNQTTNYTPQAAVRSEGSYLFQLSKQVEFDGRLLKTWSPSAVLTINQQNREALTHVTGVPLIGSLANLIAISEADRRRPMAEQIAAQKVTQQVGPRFNTEIDTVLTKLNEQLENTLRVKLQKYRLDPQRIRTLSTDDALLIGIGLSDTIPHGLTPPPISQNFSGVNLFMHEIHLNDVISQLPLANLELPDTALNRLLNFQNGVNLSPEPAVPQLATLVFDGEQPARFSIRDRAIELELRIAFRPVLGPMIPTQRITIRINVDLVDSLLVIKSEIASVQPLEPGGEAVIAEIAEKAVRAQMGDKLKQHTFPTTFNLPITTGAKATQLAVQSISLDQGWLSLLLIAQDCPVLK